MSEDNLPSIVEFSDDIGDAEAPTPLPTGIYEASIRAVEQKESQRATKYAAVSFFISPEQYPVDFTDGNPEGMTLVYRRVSLEDNPNSRYNLKRFLTAIGAPLGKRIDLSEWIGCVANVEITHDSYEGVVRAQIAKINAA